MNDVWTMNDWLDLHEFIESNLEEQARREAE